MFKIEMCQEIESCHESRKVLQSTNTVPRVRRNDRESDLIPSLKGGRYLHHYSNFDRAVAFTGYAFRGRFSPVRRSLSLLSPTAAPLITRDPPRLRGPLCSTLHRF